MVTKKNVEFPGVFVFGLGISKGSNTISWNIQRLSFVLSGIPRGKVKKLKNPGGFEKTISSNLPIWIFSGIATTAWVGLQLSTILTHTTDGGKIQYVSCP